MEFIAWCKKLVRIVQEHDADLEQAHTELINVQSILERKIESVHKFVVDCTEVHVDVASIRSEPDNIIVIGRYKNTDYIQTYSLRNSDFCELIERLKVLEIRGRLGRVDAVPNTRATVLRELDFYFRKDR